MAKAKIGFETPKEQPAATAEQVVMPAMVPTRMKKGEGVLEVTTRQHFVTEGIDIWLRWHVTRVMSILCAVGALFFISINLWLGAGTGLAAGWFYGEHVKAARKITRFYRRRRMMYTR